MQPSWAGGPRDLSLGQQQQRHPGPGPARLRGLRLPAVHSGPAAPQAPVPPHRQGLGSSPLQQPGTARLPGLLWDRPGDGGRGLGSRGACPSRLGSMPSPIELSGTNKRPYHTGQAPSPCQHLSRGTGVRPLFGGARLRVCGFAGTAWHRLCKNSAIYPHAVTVTQRLRAVLYKERRFILLTVPGGVALARALLTALPGAWHHVGQGVCQRERPRGEPGAELGRTRPRFRNLVCES